MHCIHLSDIETCNKGGTTIGKIKGEFEYAPNAEQGNKDEILYSICQSKSCDFRDCPRYIAFLENKGYEKIDIGGGVEASGERWGGKHMSCIYLSQKPNSMCCKGGPDEDNPPRTKRINYCRTNFTACPEYQRFLAANLAGKGYKKNNIVDVDASKNCKYYSKGRCKVGGKYEYKPQHNKRYGDELQNLCKDNFTDCPRYIAFLENGIE